MSALSETRAADRKRMARAVLDLATEQGANAKMRDTDPNYPTDYCVEIEAARGLCVSVDFERRSGQPNIYVLPWHIQFVSDARLHGSFGDVNRHHRRKATSVCYGFNQLRSELIRCLTLARTDAAFEDPT